MVMANFNLDQSNFKNEVKVEDCNPVEQFPPYHGWPHQYPGFVSHPWYPPYHQQQSPAIKQQIDQPPDLKQEIDVLPDLKQEIDIPPEEKPGPISTKDTFKEEHPNSQYSPQEEPPHSEYPPQHNLPQHGSFLYPPFYPPPHYNSFPPHTFPTNNYLNTNAYNPMPVWNQNGPHYNHGWQQFHQFQQNPQNVLQNYTSENKEFHSDNSNIANDLDSSSERTSDLGSSLNISSSEESSDWLAFPTKLTSSRKYSEWEEDESTLLAGWKKRSYQQGRTRRRTLYQYMSPSLEIFETRGQMVQHLELTGHSRESIAMVDSNSRRYNRHEVPQQLHNDWADDESLPSGWKSRFREWKRGNSMAKKYKYLAPNNRIFTSRTEIVLFMRNSDEYSEDDVQKVLSGYRGHGPRDPNHMYNEWIIDETLPNSWRKRFKEFGNGDRKSKKYTYMTPDNRIFNSRTEIVSFMRNSDEFSEDDVQKVMSGSGQGRTPRGVPSAALGSCRRDPNLMYNDWVFDDTLPTGWKKRFIEFKNGRNRIGKKFTYLTPNNRTFNSRIEIVSFMRNSEEFSEDDVRKVMSGSRAGIRDPNHTYHDWSIDETLPSGWKRRFKEWKNGDRKSKKYTYLSPSNRVFNSRTDVVSFMRNSKEYSEDDIEKALSGNRQGRGPRGIPT